MALTGASAGNGTNASARTDHPQPPNRLGDRSTRVQVTVDDTMATVRGQDLACTIMQRRKDRMFITMTGVGSEWVIEPLAERLRQHALNIEKMDGSPTTDPEDTDYTTTTLILSGDPKTLADIESKVLTFPKPPPETPAGQTGRPTHTVRVIALDRDGIVYDVTRTYRELGVKLCRIDVRTKGKRPKLGIVYSQVKLPDGVTKAHLEEAFRKLEGGEDWTIDITPIGTWTGLSCRSAIGQN